MNALPGRPIHVLQVSFDDSVFSAEGVEPRARQRRYSEELRKLRSGSALSVIVVGRSAKVLTESDGLTFIGLYRWAGKPGRFFSWIRLYQALVRLNKNRRIDVITTQQLNEEAWITWIFARQQKIPLVGQLHYDIFNPLARRGVFGQGFVGDLRSRLAFRLLRSCDALRVVGQRTAESARPLVRSARVCAIPVPVAKVAATTAPLVRRIGAEKNVLFVGRLAPEKNLFGWLAVAKLVAEAQPEVRFHIAGDGPLRRKLEQQVAELGLKDQVVFHGFVSYASLDALYSAASVFLLTSHYEGFGRVLVESYVAGTPVVAPRLSGVEDIVRDGTTGVLCEPGDTLSFAKAVVSLLTDSGRRDAMGYAGFLHVNREFQPQRLVASWMGLLISMASAGDAASGAGPQSPSDASPA